jgi:superfamily II DNA or RNA helicase
VTLISVPAFISRAIKVNGNGASQMLAPPQDVEITRDGRRASARLADGSSVPVVATRRGLAEGERALKVPKAVVEGDAAVPGADDLSWFGDPSPSTPAQVLASLDGSFSFLEASEESRGLGLRTPQLGAVHAVLGHWTTSADEPATVVMPTGTGKTETMVALFAAARPERLLVVVPSDALRKQIAGKFAVLGVLQSAGVTRPEALRPVVGQLDHRFAGPNEAAQFVEVCNVIVTTPNALFPSGSPQITAAVLSACSHLFVDEAHHVEARTWRQIRDAFAGKPVLQFTATPFRDDRRRLAGRQLYRFPLRLAQEQGYFSPIEYRSVIDLADPDRALADKAVARLREDLAGGYDHVLMARVNTIGRAEEIREIYEEVASDLRPVFLHSRMAVKDRTAALAALDVRDSRIIVCVDMLGEGFDLPSLKVAAIHNPHKSLGVTLQFVGRFARVAGERIGNAAVFVGRPEADYDHNLRRLFAEDADWNAIISDLTEDAVGEQEEIGEFEAGFGTEPDEVSIRSLAPKMSTVVYRTRCTDWNPDGVLSVHPEGTLLTAPLPVNSEAHVLWFVVKLETPVQWGDLPEVEEVSYHLYAMYWDEERGLLYINSSNLGSFHDQLAKAVGGSEVELIAGPEVYRAFSGIQRLVPTNVGVLDVRDRDRRFTMFAGANVTEGFSEAEAQTKTQTNIFGSGFEEGERVSIGASLRGRVWSFSAAHTLKHWVDWCDHVGPKLADPTIDPGIVKGSFILPRKLEERPELVPLAMEWPLEIALTVSEETRADFGGVSWPVADVDLRIADYSRTGPMSFEVRAPDWTSSYSAIVEDARLVYRAAEGEVLVRRGRGDWIPLSTYLGTESSGPMILLENDAMILQSSLLLQLDRDLDPYPRESLVVPPWGPDLNLRKESQGHPPDPASIQAHVIGHLLETGTWDVVLDDDGTGEVADIVALRIAGDDLEVLLVHCKYSHADTPGARLADLYEVCGQAQKSARMRHYPAAMFQQLIRRETQRVQKHGRSGFVQGDINTLYRLHDESPRLRPSFAISIAQPGLSKAEASEEQLHLLAGTEVYVRESAKARFEVLCSA